MSAKPEIHIRPFTPDDYPEIVDIYNANDPDDLMTVEGLADRDTKRDAKCKHARWVAIVDNGVVGTGLYSQDIHTYEPHRFFVSIQVHPGSQRMGIGTKLFNHIETQLKEHQPRILRSFVREDWTPGLHMLKTRGFKKHNGLTEWQLDTASFDIKPFANLESELLKHGIEIKSLPELEQNPDRNRKLHELEWELLQDVPDAEDISKLDLDKWVEEMIEDNDCIQDGYFVAVKGDEFVGISTLYKNDADRSVRQGLTGVARLYRRKGIALALKIRTISYTQNHNHPMIRTYCEATNERMIAINIRLGFIKQPEWEQHEKICG